MPSKKPPSAEQAPAARFAVAMPLWLAGFVALDLAVVLTALLTVESLIGLGLPGCGINSACAAAAASVYGKVPGLQMPVSYVGLAYFLSMLLGWLLAAQHGVTKGYRNAARLGVAASIFFVAMLIREGHLCWYCVLSHAANVVFWLMVEITSASRATVRGVMSKVAVAFIVLAVGLQGAHLVVKKQEDKKQEENLAESTAAIAAASKEKAAQIAQAPTPTPTQPPAATNGSATMNSANGATTAPPKQPSSTPPAPTNTPSAQPKAAETTQKVTFEPGDPGADRPWTGGFTGRWLRGPEKASIRIVMLFDYQCIDCQRIETTQVKQLMQQRQDVSLSVKHFPMCADCNPGFASRNLHPNACWAARAAEAAGILYGNEGFWKMHDWLFERKGAFTDHDLSEGLAALGFDRPKFIQTMKSEETLQRVTSDISEGMWLGLYYTPMIFINGIELKGVFAHNAVTRAVADLVMQNLPPMTCDQDQPPPALEKAVADWREGVPRMLPPDPQSWPKGDATAPLRIVLWGDYQEPYTAKADAMIQKFLATQPKSYYEFRHYPVNQLCNPAGNTTKHPLACRAAAAAEAAGMLGGAEAYWHMHDWLMTSQQTFNDAALRDAATGMGLDPDALFAQMETQEVKNAIAEDAKTARSLGLQSIPFIFVNDRHVQRWMLGDKPAMDLILNEAIGRK